MSDTLHSDSQHRRPHAPPMAAPFLEFDLKRELEQLHSEPGWGTGQNARTLVKYDDFRVDLHASSLLALDQGIPHDVEALAESAFLLTIAWPGRNEKE